MESQQLVALVKRKPSYLVTMD